MSLVDEGLAGFGLFGQSMDDGVWTKVAAGEEHSLVLFQSRFVAAGVVDGGRFEFGDSGVGEVEAGFTEPEGEPDGGEETVVAGVHEVGDLAVGHGAEGVGGSAAEGGAGEVAVDAEECAFG